MARPRFHALPEARRRAILDAAARAFAEHGYQRASLNEILADVHVSKGAAYYYFDDKADLFATVVDDAWASIAEGFASDLEALDEATFWPTLEALHRRQLRSFASRPWTWRAAKAAGPALADPVAGPALRERLASPIRVLARLLKRARRLGVIRKDLPEDVVLAMVSGVDDALDSWLLERPARARNAKVARAAFAALRQVVEGPRA